MKLRSTIAPVAVSAAFLFLTACSGSTDGSELTAPAEFLNEENYNAELSTEVIKADLQELADLGQIELGAANAPSSFKIASQSSRFLGPLAESEPECMDMSEKEEYGVEGSGNYSLIETKFFYNGEEANTCNFSPSSSNFKIDLTSKQITEDGDIKSEMDLEGTMKVSVNQSTGSASVNADYTFTGSIVKGELKIDQWGTVDLDMKTSEEGIEMTMGMDMNLHFLNDKYRCSMSLDMSADMNDAFGDSDLEATAINSCDLTHGGTNVGRIEMSGDEMTIYDLDGNEIESSEVVTQEVL